MIAWRLVPEKFVDTAMTGIGGMYASGRWHSQGNPIVYAASSQALATLEVLVHMDKACAPEKLSLLELQFPESILQKLSAKRLPKDWRQTPSPDALKNIGDDWLQNKQSAVLSVPSAIVLDEGNYLINPAHSDFAKVKLKETHSIKLDQRLL